MMFGKVLFAALPFISAVFAQTTTGCDRNATTTAGDTCDSIAHKYGVPVYQFALLNDEEVVDACDALPAGITVCLGVSGYDCTQIYTVVANDTCEWIQSIYGINNATFLANNPQFPAGNCDDNLYVGEVVCVATDAFNYPAVNQTTYQSLAWSFLPVCTD